MRGPQEVGFGSMTRYIGILMLTASLLALPVVAGAQATGADNDSRAMCDPVTLSDLFPEPVEPELPDTPISIGGRGQAPTPTTTTTTVPAPAPAVDCRPFVYEMGSPVGKAPVVISGFGADRPDGRKHKGADVAGPKLMPVYAVSDGVVSYFGGECCSLAIRHTDGWTSYYIHLNNDSLWLDDGLGWGIAPGLELGTPVKRGQLIGWNGDSGNAETTVPHVHFELRMPDGTAVDAVPSLQASQSTTKSTSMALTEASSAPVVVEFDAASRFTYPYTDDDNTHYEAAIGELTALGIMTGCGVPLGSAFCPDLPVYGADVEDFIRNAFGLDVAASDIVQYDPPTGAKALAAMVSVFDCGIGRYCDTEPLTAGAVAQMFAAIGEAQPLRGGPSVLGLAACDLPLSDPDRVITRAEFAAAAADLLGLATEVECGPAN